MQHGHREVLDGCRQLAAAGRQISAAVTGERVRQAQPNLTFRRRGAVAHPGWSPLMLQRNDRQRRAEAEKVMSRRKPGAATGMLPPQNCRPGMGTAYQASKADQGGARTAARQSGPAPPRLARTPYKVTSSRLTCTGPSFLPGADRDPAQAPGRQLGKEREGHNARLRPGRKPPVLHMRGYPALHTYHRNPVSNEQGSQQRHHHSSDGHDDHSSAGTAPCQALPENPGSCRTR